MSHQLRSAWRSLRGARSASVAAVVVLGVGVSLVTLIFSLGDRYLWRALPYGNHERVVTVDLVGPTAARRQPLIADWRARTDLFVGLAVHQDGDDVRLDIDGRGRLLRVAQVSDNFFDVLGWPRPAGWGIDRPTSAVLLPEARGRVGASGLVTGRPVPRHGGGSVTIAGTLPDGFVFPDRYAKHDVDALVPFEPPPHLWVTTRRTEGGGWSSSRPQTVVARLRPGVDPDLVAQALTGALPARTVGGRAVSVSVRRVKDVLVGRLGTLTVGALAGAALVLLACAGNLAILLLARQSSRASELATRRALGATRVDLALQQGLELTLIAMSAAVVGFVIARLALRGIAPLLPVQFDVFGDASPASRTVMFALLSSAAAAILGALPLTVTRRQPDALFSAGRSVSGRPLHPIRFALIAGQMALATLLVAGASLLGRSYLNLVTQETGFADRTIVLDTSYPADRARGATAADVAAAIERLRRLPGITSAGAAEGALVDGSHFETSIRIDGVEQGMAVKYVTPSFFDAVGLSLAGGRPFDPSDPALGVLIINERAARQYWPGASAVGRVVHFGDQEARIIGVVSDTRSFALDVAPAPEVYRPLREPGPNRSLVFALAASRSTAGLTALAARAIQEVTPAAVVTDAGSLRGRLLRTVATRTFAATVIVVYASCALTLCVAGLVGLVTFVVTQRRREIAVRMALGARHAELRRLVIRPTVIAAAVGLTVGLGSSWSLSRILERLVFGVEPGDPATMAFAAGVMIAAVLVAAWIPSRLATRVPIWEILRQDS